MGANNKDQGTIDQEVMAAEIAHHTQRGEAELAEADEQRMLTTRRERELDKLAGGLPDDAKALWMYAEHSLTQSAVSMIDAGRAFIKLKEILPHGDYEAGLVERGISPRSAREISAAARRFADRSEKFLKLGRTKLYACMDFSDDDLDALEEGESVLDVTLDDLDRMTTRELKDTIKKVRADNDVKDKLLSDKNSKIDELATELERKSGAIGMPEESEYVQSIQQTGQHGLSQVVMLRGIANRMAHQEELPDIHEVAALTAALNNIRTELALAFELVGQAAPGFQAQMEGTGIDLESWRNFEMPGQ